MKKLSFISILFLCLLFCASSVLAIPWNYTYIGGTYDTVIDNDPPPGSYSYTDRVEISLTTNDGMLPDGIGVDLKTYISSYTFSDGRQILTNSNSTFSGSSSMNISGGVINYWYVYADSVLNGNVSGSITSYGDSTGMGDYYDEAMIMAPAPSRSYDSAKYTSEPIAGWTANPANPVPEPTTMLLFGAGLVGLAGFGRKKFKK